MVTQVIYHATTSINWMKIKRSGFKLPIYNLGDFYLGQPQKKPGSLGYGIYGFLEDAQLASEFITKTTNVRKYAIIRLI